MVLVEARSCVLPLISLDCDCGPAEIITEGENGYLVPLGNIKDLSEKICFLIEHPTLRNKMSLRSIEFSKQFRLNIIMEKWLRLFNSLSN